MVGGSLVAPVGHSVALEVLEGRRRGVVSTTASQMRSVSEGLCRYSL